MFICRHQLLRAFKPRYTSHFLTTRRLVNNSQLGSTRSTDVRPSQPPNPSTTSSQADAGVPFGGDSIINQTGNLLTTPTGFSVPSSRPTKRSQESLAFVQALARDIENNGSVSAETVDQITQRLTKNVRYKDFQLVDLAIEHILAITSTQPALRVDLLRKVLDTLMATNWFHKPAILRVLQSLQATQPSLEMPFEQFARLTDRFLSLPISAADDGPALSILAPIITDYTIRVHDNERLVVKPYTPSVVSWVQFQMLMRLVQSQQNGVVLASLRRLVQFRVIPSSALANLDMGGREFGNVVLNILVRCCTSLCWVDRGAALLKTNLIWGDNINPSFAQDIAELIDVIIQDQSSDASTQNAAHLITRFLTLRHVRVPPTLLNRFFRRARERHEDTLAMSVYQVLRSPEVRSSHHYPVPSGDILVWMLRRCHVINGVHVMRILLSHIVEENIELREPARALIVQISASHGMFSPARRLWERAVAQKDMVVLRDSGVLSRLVSLAQSRIRDRKRRLERVERLRREAHSHDTSTSPPSTSSPPASGQPGHNPFSSVELESDVSLADDGAEDNHDDQHCHEPGFYLKQIDDYQAFTDSVIRTFVDYNSPLYEATREQINALARAYITRGNAEAGLETLRITLDRGDIPDIHDANVALSAVAVKNPAQAAQVIERMVSLGVKPDAVSFGTVIHYAALGGDMELVAKLVARSRDLDIPSLSYKTIGKLIRICIVPRPQDGLTRQDSLKVAKKLIESLVGAGQVPSPNMVLDCVNAALRADDPVSAYDFWAQMLRTKVQADDRLHQAVRLRIGRHLWHNWKRQSLKTAATRRMLLDLGFESSVGDLDAHFGKGRAPMVPPKHRRRTTDSKGPEQ